nr:MAG TPA: hypothetical protein [Bacteriophage sp.]
MILQITLMLEHLGSIGRIRQYIHSTPIKTLRIQKQEKI